MANEKKQANSFRAKSDAGKEYLIFEYQDRGFTVYGKPIDESLAWKKLITADGQPGHYINSTTFRIEGSNEVIRKI